MSLLSDLERHERNPCNNWGRYSASPSSLVRDFSNPPENDLVQLVTLSPTSPRTRRSSLRNLKKQIEKPIEIIDDKYQSKLRSNTDKNPKHFHVHTFNFTIPKTKKQTANESKELPSKNNGTRKMATQLQLVPDAQGRSTKRTSTGGNSTPKKLRRSWLHTEQPRSSDDDVRAEDNHGGSPPSTDKLVVKRRGNNRSHKEDTPLPSTKEMSVHIVDLRSSQETEIVNECDASPDRNVGKASLTKTPKSYQVEEIRCQLCDDVITETGCVTCPKASDEEIPQTFMNSDEISKDEFLVPVKKKDQESPEFGFGDENQLPAAQLIAESDEERLKTDEIKTSVQVNVVSSESQDSDFPETSVPNSNITQDDLFCELCGKARSKKGCGCSKNTGEIAASKFYPRSRPYNKRYSGKKYGGKLQTKRKRTKVNTKKNIKTSNADPLQTTLDASGETNLSDEHKKRRRKKKNVPKEPECVHISSDEDEVPAETTGQGQENDNDNHDASIKNDDTQNRMHGGIDDGHTKDEVEKREEKSVVSSSDSQAKVVKSLDGSMPAQENVDKQKVVEKTLSLCQEDAYIYIMVKYILVGELMCTPSEPVEVRENKIVFKVEYQNENLQFKLEKNEFQSFKIHSEDGPLIVIITPTPYWARKYVERYKKFGIFIDPGNIVYNKKHIMFILNEAMNGTTLEALIELIDHNLSDEPIVEKISQKEANAEGERIISAFDSKNNKIATKALSSTSVDNLNKSRKSTPSVFKTYSTRSKSSVVTPSAPKPPSKKVLVYQPLTKLDGVTITSEDMLCLEPSTYLNDVIIDFFFKYLIDVKLTAEDKERIHLFSTFFYDKLTQKNTSNEPRTPTTMHRMVKSWTKNVDVFSKDFLIIPINESSHWYLVIICYPRMVADTNQEISQEMNREQTGLDTAEQASEEQGGKESGSDDFDKTLMATVVKSKNASRRKSRESVGPIKARPCILVFDSLGTNRRSGVISNLRNYLNCEWKERKDNSTEVTFDKDTLKACYPKVPHQENYSDCGLYVLQYFESFFTTPIEDYKFPINLLSWFPQDEMATKRQHIINVILELQARAESLKTR